MSWHKYIAHMAPNLKGTGNEVMDPISRNGVKKNTKKLRGSFQAIHV